MRKGFYFAIIIALLLVAFYKSDYFNLTQTGSSNEPTIIHENGKAFEIRPLGYFSNFIANLLAKIAQSPGGQEFMTKLIRPMQNSQAENASYLDAVFSIVDKVKSDEKKDRAYCGSTVVVDYSIWQNEQIIVLENDKEMTLSDHHIPALVNIIVGMQVGATRSAIIPYWCAGSLQSKMPSSQKKANGLKIQVVLKKVLSSQFENVRLFQNSNQFAHPILCGQSIAPKLRIWTLNNQLLFDDIFPMRLGDSKCPMIFSYSLFNTIAASPISILAYGKYFMHFGGSFNPELKNLNSYREQLLLLEVY